MRVRSFSKVGDQYPLPNLVDIQTKSFEDFLQLDVAPRKRKNQGLETILRESFPIESHDGSIRLEYICYELGKPRYSADECRKLRLSYGMPFRIWARLHKSQGEAIEEEVYLGEVPIMMGGGESPEAVGKAFDVPSTVVPSNDTNVNSAPNLSTKSASMLALVNAIGHVHFLSKIAISNLLFSLIKSG